MLIKPITETRNPRHTLEDEDENQPNFKPTITVKLTKQPRIAPQTVLVMPSTISILQDQLKFEPIGLIHIDYPELYESIDKSSELEYDEDEQLYVALKNQNLKNKYPKLDVPVVANSDISVVSITIPHFYNAITYNLVAREVIKTFSETRDWIVLAPCGLNNNQSVNKLLAGQEVKRGKELMDQVPELKPPHAITGIAGSVVSQLNLSPGKNITCLVLNSEGQPGFEKSDNDSIVDVSYLLVHLFEVVNQQEYLNAISNKVRKFNGAFSNLGMYI
ncbi:hypothetical protein Cantr_01755 [Candida viswanathii]|uniref:Proteasome assembly chaperone 1 n=1 Tax=Candida viswanathii TaxID=5486 RepID=A0A367YJK4_9ASCO|nr:hypothetical protein Cantr_01755 [Candida viswanathii]